ncbi:MAG: Ku protein, partial [Stellaceae bacterium]
MACTLSFATDHPSALVQDAGYRSNLGEGEIDMAYHPSWKGHLKVSLVSCPVALYNATTHTRMVSFHLLNPDTMNRIQMRPYDPDEGEVE